MNEHEDNREDNADFIVNPVSAAQHGPPPEVHFFGVMSADPRPQHPAVPVAYRSHSLIRKRFFYTIPEQLLQSVCRPQVDESFEFDEELLQMELDLSRFSGDHGLGVGFWNNLTIECQLMYSNPMRKENLMEFFNFSEQEASELVTEANRQLLSFSDIACGYAGWLMTHPDFLGELNALTSAFAEQMHRWGTAMVGLPIPSSQPPGLFNPTGEEGWAEYDAAVLAFCLRWRLQGLAGPRIPIPMRPMMSGQFPLSIVEQLMRAGGVFNWPDTFPLFARDELRSLLAGALKSSDSEHLAGWRRIIDSSNKAKNQIGTLERRFRLQHFWRLLRERHPEAFRRRLNRIERAFAEYLGVDESTIRLDRTTIAKAIGENWDQRVESATSVRRPR